MSRLPGLYDRDEDERVMAGKPEWKPMVVNPEDIAIAREGMEMAQKVTGAEQIMERPKVAAKLVKDSDLPVAEKKKALRDIQDPSKVTAAVVRGSDMQKEPSIKDSFMESLAFFMPQAIGGLVGSAIAGTDGAVAGMQGAGQLVNQYRDYQFKSAKNRREEEELKLKKDTLQSKAGKSDLETQIKISNLKARWEDLRLQRERTSNLEEDRELRSDERDIERLTKAKDAFVKRNDIKNYREGMDDINAIKDLVKYGKKIPDASLAKVARAISGEVGVLTDKDIKRSQINPDFYSKLRRNATRFFKGELTEEDKAEMLKITNALEEKRKERLSTKIDNFAKSRGKNVRNKTYASEMAEDIKNELGLVKSETAAGKGSVVNSKDKMSSWDENKRKRYEEWKKSRGNK